MSNRRGVIGEAANHIGGETELGSRNHESLAIGSAQRKGEMIGEATWDDALTKRRNCSRIQSSNR
jgi:hypothetical protein